MLPCVLPCVLHSSPPMLPLPTQFPACVQAAAQLRRPSPYLALLDPGGDGSIHSRGDRSPAAADRRVPSPDGGMSAVAGVYLNLEPYLHPAPPIVQPACPAGRLHQMMVSLSLRHVCVVGEGGEVCGIVTRRDLQAAVRRVKAKGRK
jgi:hypothetical protein